MKLVIDIPERYHEMLQTYPDEHLGSTECLIKNGTPLPKCHGRLIDADAELEGLRKMKVVDEKDKQSVRFAILNFENAPTIIEAESEE